MKEYKVPVQSLIDHIKTAVDVDDWAKEMAEDLLKRQEPKPMTEYDDGWDCPSCGLKLMGKTASGYPYSLFDMSTDDEVVKYCPVCGQAVKWDD